MNNNEGDGTMTDEELQQLTKRISIEYFGKPFNHQAYFNHRLRTTGGRYLLRNHNIEMNKKYYDIYGLSELEGIIKHELCHYHLHIEGKGYKHGDADFKELLHTVGGFRYCTPLKEEKDVNILYYCCTKCNYVYKRRRRVNIKKYVCGKCSGVLSLVKENR